MLYKKFNLNEITALTAYSGS